MNKNWWLLTAVSSASNPRVQIDTCRTKISAIFQERICESTVSSSGRAIGSLAGAAVGQATVHSF